MIYPEYKEILEQEGNEKEFEYKGYKCRILRIEPETMGHLCGYIEIPFEHELYQEEYDDIEKHYDWNLPAHGGLTFSG